jgi:hypothetical protein
MPTISMTGIPSTFPNVPTSHTDRVSVGTVSPTSMGGPGTAPRVVDVKLQ